MPYVRFMSLVAGSAAAITDSGGIQEETTYLGIPCLTLRENTERPVTISEGTNRLVRPETLGYELERALAAKLEQRRVPELWDGRTAARCLADLRRRTSPFGAVREQPREPLADSDVAQSGDDRRTAAGRRYRRAS
jgi:UDP-N-acetylglucosamine 2-epimerase (non-hydrolysing)